MAKRLNPLEKEFLVKRFLNNPEVNIYDFCGLNKISPATLKKWIKLYQSEGLEGLFQGCSSINILPEGIKRSDENYKREILKLRIENERLKKNYMVKTNPNGGKIYIRLKEKNLK